LPLHVSLIFVPCNKRYNCAVLAHKHEDLARAICVTHNYGGRCVAFNLTELYHFGRRQVLRSEGGNGGVKNFTIAPALRGFMALPQLPEQ